MSQGVQGSNVMVTGRIVWLVGDLFEGEPAMDDRTNQRKVDKTGQPMTNYGFGLAVPKSELGKISNPVNLENDPGAIWYAIHVEAQKMFPPPAQVPPGDKFAWKFKDGDSIDHNGMPFAGRDGYAGCMVFALTTTIPIKFFRWENGQNQLVTSGIKCGDYVRVQVGVKPKPGSGTIKPGLYLNPNAVQFLGFGALIESRVSGDTIFGQAAPALPPGATMMPTAPSTGMLIPPNAAPQGFAPPLATPSGGTMVQNFMPAAAAPQPHYPVLPQVVQAQMQPQAPMMPPMPQMGNGQMSVGVAPVGNPGMMQSSMVAPTAAFPSNGLPPMPQAPAAQQFPQIPGMNFPQPQ